MSGNADLTRLEKHGAVLQLLTNLKQRLDGGAFQIVDHWESDLDAVGIAHPSSRELLAYIAAYGPVDFYVELEFPPAAGSDLPYSAGGAFRCRTWDEVAEIVARHFASHPRQ